MGLVGYVTVPARQNDPKGVIHRGVARLCRPREQSQLDLGGKKGYPICTDCHGRGLDVVTHGQAVRTGAAAKKAKGKQRASQHKSKKATAASKRRLESSDEDEDDEDEGEEEEEGEEGDDDEEEGEESDGAEAEATRYGSAAGQMEKGIWTVKRLIAKEERGAEGLLPRRLAGLVA